MTQDELDALMGGDMDIENMEDDTTSETSEEEKAVEEVSLSEDEPYNETDAEKYRVDATHNWPPPPPTDDNRMVNQLDDVTKESEEKATEIFDIIEDISNELMEKETNVQKSVDVLSANVELFTTLCEKFPGVESFQKALSDNEEALEGEKTVLEVLQNSGDQIMSVMDIMQYQDIHRQKIERVINVMRALSNYMNQLFSGKVDDDKRVGSAVHLPGDTNSGEIVDTDDIEALLASFGQQ